MMMAYKLTIFFVMLTFSLQILENSGIVPGDVGNVDYPKDLVDPNSPSSINATLFSKVPDIFVSGWVVSVTQDIILATVFGLLMKVLPITQVILFFGFSLGSYYIAKLDLPWEWTAAMVTLLTIIFVSGYVQYKGKTNYTEQV